MREHSEIESAPLQQPPDLIIIGAQKLGTSSLYRYLRRHPNIGVIIIEEVRFFFWRYSKDMDLYRARFPLRGEVPVAGVPSLSDLLHPLARGRVREV